MRGYYFPLVAGIALIASTFLPWVVVGDTTLRGIPNVPALWVAGLGVIAVALATLSIITRKNSRHPLLVVGLAALGILVLSGRVLPRAMAERAASMAEALAIVEGTPAAAAPAGLIGIGIYIGIAASTVIALFGMTIVIKRAAQPYAVASADDDV